MASSKPDGQLGTAEGSSCGWVAAQIVACVLHALEGAQTSQLPLVVHPHVCSAPTQVLPIEGQNDGSVDDLLISPAEFEGWVGRHRAALARLAGLGGGTEAVHLVAESNEAMQGSYAMLDASCRCGGCWRQPSAPGSAALPCHDLQQLGKQQGMGASSYPHRPARCACHRRFFSNATGAHAYGEPIFSAAHPEGGVAAAWASVSGFDSGKFAARGGVYDWGQGGERLEEQQGRWRPPGAGNSGRI